jgi:phenylalanine-4-hydroxylase
MVTPVVTAPNYTAEDHQTWATLYERQMKQVGDCACRLFYDGMARLKLDPKHLPDKNETSAKLNRMTGWTLADAQNEYLSAIEWYEHTIHHRFPVTNYIRRPHEIDFTPLPDLFHEYFGHLALFTDQEFADTYYMIGPLYLSGNERQRLEVSRLSWFTTEFGIMREEGQLKIFGAGLFSSIGELAHAFAPETPRYEFDIRRVAETPAVVHNYHDHYFIFDGLPHLRHILQEYARMEGLPIPPYPNR